MITTTETKAYVSRRRFIQLASSGLIAAPVAHLLATRVAAWPPPQNPTPEEVLAGAPGKLSWKTVIASAGEPGEPLVVSGTIYHSNRKTPVEGALLYVYHTDARGYYSRPVNDAPHQPRLRGWMKTGPDGRYEFHTIKPAPYPGRVIPAHIHGAVGAPGYAARWLEDYWFEGDPFLKPGDIARNAALGSYSEILRLKRERGTLFGVRDIRLG